MDRKQQAVIMYIKNLHRSPITSFPDDGRRASLRNVGFELSKSRLIAREDSIVLIAAKTSSHILNYETPHYVFSSILLKN
jgi:hypothetical protein